MEYRENVPLNTFSTLRVGGEARFFVRISSLGDLKSACTYARENNLPIFILGGGSNTLFSDAGWGGLVIKMEIEDIEWKEQGDTTIVTAGAGVNWDELVEMSVERGWYGLENLSLIPGTVGASPIQNIGAYGAEVSDVISDVRALNMDAGEVRTFSSSECNFSYRNSFFKTTAGKEWIIFEVCFLLKKEGELNTSYAGIEEYLKTNEVTNPSLSDVREAVISLRTSKLPDFTQYGTAGSFFKNPVVSEQKYAELCSQYPGMLGYESQGGIKISLAWVLDHILHLKGYWRRDVGLYERQPLVIVTKKGAHSRDVKDLSSFIQQKVREVLDIDIEPEVRFISPAD